MPDQNLDLVDRTASVAGKAVSGDVAEKSGPASMTDNDDQAIIDAPPAGRHAVRVLRVTLVAKQSGNLGYELLLQSGAHLWRPRPLWLRSDRVPPAIVKRDLDNVLVPLLRPVAAPGALTEAEAADAMIGLTFVATVSASGAVTKAEDATPARAGVPS